MFTLYDPPLGDVTEWASSGDWAGNGDWFQPTTTTLYTDSMLVGFVITDPALSSADQLYLDVLNAVRILNDTELASVNVFYPHTYAGRVNANPYWRWRFVRQGGHLFLIPAKSATAWAGADVVSSDFRYNSDLLPYAMNSLTAVWAAHSGSPTATLKTAIDTALGVSGFKDMEGNLLT